MTTTFQKATTFEVVSCGECGVQFALSSAFIVSRKSDRKTFYCPNGHGRWFPGETAADKAQRLASELDIERTRLAQRNKQLDYARRAAKANGTRLRKVKQRVGHGVCPCCNRTFAQLAQHMATKHPSYAKDTDHD